MPNIRKLNKAEFTSHTVQSGGQVTVDVQWESNIADDLTLNFDADQFELKPQRVPLPANNAGTKRFNVIVKKLGAAKHCDVNFTFGDEHDQDSVEVT